MWRNGPKTLAKPTYFYQLKIVIEFSSADDIKNHLWDRNTVIEYRDDKKKYLKSNLFWVPNTYVISEVGIYEKEHV